MRDCSHSAERNNLYYVYKSAAGDGLDELRKFRTQGLKLHKRRGLNQLNFNSPLAAAPGREAPCCTIALCFSQRIDIRCRRFQRHRVLLVLPLDGPRPRTYPDAEEGKRGLVEAEDESLSQLCPIQGSPGGGVHWRKDLVGGYAILLADYA